MSSIGRPTWLEVDLSALVHNFTEARRLAGPGVQVWPVVKADAYGLGAVAVSRALAEAGADGLCVTLLEEALPLREAGITLPILLLSGLFPGQEAEAVRLRLEAMLLSPDDLPRLAGHGAAQGVLPLHLKLDTGMGRLGFSPDKVVTVLDEIDRLSGVVAAAIVSHMARADQPKKKANREQIAAVHRIREEVARPRGIPVSLANSAALAALPEARFDRVRPGIMLYGGSPFHPEPAPADLSLRPVVTWKSAVVQVRALPAKSAIGYGHTFVTARDSRIAQVAVGYADGYDRNLGNRGEVLVLGKRAPVVGRVCMDLISVDVTDIPATGAGTPVTLLGRDGGGFIGVDEMAGWLGTIPYEVLCAIGPRVPRVYRPMACSEGVG